MTTSLNDSGTLVRRDGATRFNQRAKGVSALAADVAGTGKTLDTTVIFVGEAVVPAEFAGPLDLAAGDRVLVRERQYQVDGRPVQYALSYIPLDIATADSPIRQENPGPGGIYGRIEDAGFPLETYVEQVKAIRASGDVALQLPVEDGDPVQRIVRFAVADGGRVVEICDTYIDPAAMQIEYRIPQ